MVDWFRRRTGKDEPSNGATEVGPGETAKSSPEPADGFSEAGVREALRDVRDPEIGRDLVSLNMIKSIELEGSNVTVGVSLTTAGCPMKHRITTDIKDRLAMIEGVTGVEVDFGVMTDEDRQNLLTSLHGGPFGACARLQATSPGPGSSRSSPAREGLASPRLR